MKLKRPHWFLVGLTSISLIISVAACGNDAKESVRVDGSSTVGPLTSVAAELFAEESNVKVSVGTSGTGGGFEKFCNKEIDIVDASRPIKDTEKQLCDSNKVEYRELIVANDALTVAVNKNNSFVTCLTTAELKKIWDQGSPVTNWNQVRSSFPSRPLKLFGPGTDSGTFDYFTDEINGKEGQSRTDYTASENDNVLVQGIAGDENGLGYFGYTYFEENTDKLKAVSIDSGQGCVTPTKQTAQDGSYKPLSRPLFIYVSSAAVERDSVADFVRFYVDNVDKVAKEAKFVPLTDEQKQKLKSESDALTAA